MKYNVTYIGDSNIGDVHHIGLEYNGNYYSVIFGKYVNGGFFSIPNWNYGGELADFSDIFWNIDSINKAVRNKKLAEVIANTIAEFGELLSTKEGRIDYE